VTSYISSLSNVNRPDFVRHYLCFKVKSFFLSLSFNAVCCNCWPLTVFLLRILIDSLCKLRIYECFDWPRVKTVIYYNNNISVRSFCFHFYACLAAPPACHSDSILTGHSLKGGTQAGRFEVLGETASMHACLQRCCAKQTCDVGILIDGRCYGVACYSEDLCKAMPVPHPHFIFSQLGFVNKGQKRGDIERNQGTVPTNLWPWTPISLPDNKLAHWRKKVRIRCELTL